MIDTNEVNDKRYNTKAFLKIILRFSFKMIDFTSKHRKRENKF